MKKILTFKNFMLLLFLSVVVLSCDKDDENGMQEMEAQKNIVKTAIDTETLSSLVAALTQADENENSDLIGTLSGNGPFTVFAPTDDAFTALLQNLEGFDSLEDFDTEEEKTLLARILQYHVVAGVAAASTDLSEGQTIATVQGESVSISLEGGVFIGDATEDDAKVVGADVQNSNGIVHIINKVLLPQEILNTLNPPQDLVDLVIATEALSSLEAAVIKADLVETLKSEGPFTVFAPTDDAFTGLLMALGDDYNSLDDFDTDEEIALLRDILLFHVIPAKVLAADLAEGEVETALADNSIKIIAEGDTFVIGDASDTNATITGTDIMATNGVAHTINKVLLPQSAIDFLATLELKNIVELAIATDDLSILVDALVAANAGLVETLSSEGPFTVFAPTNAAFVGLLDILGDDYNALSDFDTQEEIDLLVKILTYHVVAGTEAFAADLSDGQSIATVNGASVGINLKNGTVHVVDATDDNATVVIPDVDASNGVVHVINKVLLPQEAVDFVASLQLKNIVELAIATDDLSILVDALVAANAGLVETLSGKGPFTVFAPTNTAFVGLLDILGDDYNALSDFDTQEEIDLLVKILTYHVVAGTEAFAADLSNGQSIPTVNGASIGINLKNGTVHVVDATDDNATVVIPDVDASNGVVHVINKVLLPQEAVDFVASLQLKNIVEIAIATDDLSLLVDALVAADAGLVEVLSSEGPFTVFAPTNQAFVDLLDILGDDFTSLSDFDTEAEIDILIQVLKYHVVAGIAAFSDDLSDGQEIGTLQGENVTVNLNHGVFIQDATETDAEVVIPNVEASNGVVHVINKVLLPQEVLDILFPPSPNIVELAQSVDDLSLLVDALVQADAGLVDALSGEGPFTVFAPTNKAFANLLHQLGGNYNSLSDFDTPEEKALLAKILTYHVVAGAAVAATDLSNHQEFETLQGESIFAILNHGVFIRDKTHVDAQVIGADNVANNGIVHIINKVLLPQEVIDALH
ncbi:fasciclin domain-containing protein [uncultured Croceitalea sp.]|uniref:fasciclin domain-containing protein n=1 Tax=uncultured Croceitalea sp. TaxID=1798908 RepID=UPI003305759C